MIYAKIANGALTTATVIHDSAGRHDANAESPTTPAGWSLVADEVNAEEIAEDGFPVLTRRQIRLALIGIGITAEHVDAVIAQIPDAADREQAKIFWEDTNQFHRNHPLIAQIAAALSIDAPQLDASWANAVTLDNN